ncbi:MAG: SIMPL domain-containing protein [Pseudomonadota bacterium]
MRSLMVVAALLVAAPAFAADLAAVPVRSITTSGQAERKIAPDQAHVNVNVSALNVKLDAAKAEHDKKLRDVMAIAKKAGIDEAQMKTLNASVQPQYSYDNNKRSFRGYQVQTALDITVKNIDTVGELIEKLTGAGLENGANAEWGNLINVSYTIGNPDKIRDDMLVDAIKNARAKAESMAAAAGGSVGSVIQINEGSAPQFNFPVPMMARAMVASAPMMEKSVAPPVGEQDVNANVTVIFELK